MDSQTRARCSRRGSIDDEAVEAVESADSRTASVVAARGNPRSSASAIILLDSSHILVTLTRPNCLEDTNVALAIALFDGCVEECTYNLRKSKATSIPSMVLAKMSSAMTIRSTASEISWTNAGRIRIFSDVGKNAVVGACCTVMAMYRSRLASAMRSLRDCNSS